MSTERSKEWADGYRQAVLDAARCLAHGDHLRDTYRKLSFLWRAAGLAGSGPPTNESGSDVDSDRLEQMGARPPHDVADLERGREVALLDALTSALTSWPSMSAAVVDDLAAALGVTIQRSKDGEHARVDPDTLPAWYRNAYEQDGVEW
jgi:hypothetical protein